MAIKRTDFRHLAHTGGRVKPHYYTTPVGKFEFPDWIKDLKNYYKYDVFFSLASDASCHPNYIDGRTDDGSYISGYAGGKQFFIAQSKEILRDLMYKYQSFYPDKHLGIIVFKRPHE